MLQSQKFNTLIFKLQSYFKFPPPKQEHPHPFHQLIIQVKVTLIFPLWKKPKQTLQVHRRFRKPCLHCVTNTALTIDLHLLCAHFHLSINTAFKTDIKINSTFFYSFSQQFKDDNLGPNYSSSFSQILECNPLPVNSYLLFEGLQCAFQVA